MVQLRYAKRCGPSAFVHAALLWLGALHDSDRSGLEDIWHARKLLQRWLPNDVKTRRMAQRTFGDVCCLFFVSEREHGRHCFRLKVLVQESIGAVQRQPSHVQLQLKVFHRMRMCTKLNDIVAPATQSTNLPTMSRRQKCTGNPAACLQAFVKRICVGTM